MTLMDGLKPVPFKKICEGFVVGPTTINKAPSGAKAEYLNELLWYG
jgi:hypothetical protein